MLSRCAGPACLSDRAAAAIRLVNKDFGKTLIKVDCSNYFELCPQSIASHHLVDSMKGIVNLDVAPLENKPVSKLSSLKLNTRL